MNLFHRVGRVINLQALEQTTKVEEGIALVSDLVLVHRVKVLHISAQAKWRGPLLVAVPDQTVVSLANLVEVEVLAEDLGFDLD